jgi:hypothetical protein
MRKRLRLESFVRVKNDSGEDYENAQVRLVVGTINSGGKNRRIGETAGRARWKMNSARRRITGNLRQQAARKMMAPACARGR